jgi:hypothetical protein
MMSKINKDGGNEHKEARGRKSKYYTHIQPYLDAIAAMCRNGATLDNLAEKFKVNKGTLCDYKNLYPEFKHALDSNNEIADFTVENALYKNAVDGNLTAQIFWLKNRQSKRWRDKQHVFQASSTVVRKDYDHMTEDELEREMQQLEGVLPEEMEDIEGGEIH